MTSASVSVIISTYNHANLLPQAIDSLLNQTRVPDEIIVIDDGSTDNTPEVFEQYQESIIGIRQSNKGLAGGRNTGLRSAQGDLIAFLDADDYLPPESIEKRARCLEQNPEFKVVYCNALITDLQNHPIGLFTDARPGPRPSGMIFVQLAQYNIVLVHACMFWRKCLEEVGVFDESLRSVEDYDFWLRMAAVYPFLYLDEPLVYYRVHDQMMTNKHEEEFNQNQLVVSQRIYDMPYFQHLPVRDKAIIYYKQGIKNMLLGEVAEARKRFLHSIQAHPLHPRAYALFGLTLLGKRIFVGVYGARQRVRGDLQMKK
jgi:glycosyltransferase involved in cell wall biosynthesis